MSATATSTKSGHVSPRPYPVPDGLEPFRTDSITCTDGSVVEVESYFYGWILVSVAHADLHRLEIKNIELEGEPLESFLLGGGASADSVWVSLYIDSEVCLAECGSALAIEFSAVADGE